MSKKLFVGNLAWGATPEQVSELFSQYGELEDVFLPKERETGRARGFGFVTFVDDAAGDEAIEALNETDFEGRNLIVNEARPRD